jgi:hypothetical protein
MATLGPPQASAMLYCSAIANYSLDYETGRNLLSKCKMDTSDLKSLLPIWSMKILGFLIETDLTHVESQEVMNAALKSTNPRDRDMVSFLLGMHEASRVVLTQSIKQQKILETIRRKYGPSIVSEFMVLPGIYVDGAVVGRKLAIEVQGPSHYLVNSRTGEKRLNGPSVYKKQLIENKGWKVVHINV